MEKTKEKGDLLKKQIEELTQMAADVSCGVRLWWSQFVGRVVRDSKLASPPPHTHTHNTRTHTLKHINHTLKFLESALRSARAKRSS